MSESSAIFWSCLIQCYGVPTCRIQYGIKCV